MVRRHFSSGDYAIALECIGQREAEGLLDVSAGRDPLPAPQASELMVLARSWGQWAILQAL